MSPHPDTKIRPVITEYGVSTPIVAELASSLGKTPAAIEAMITRRGEAIQRRHGLKENPLICTREGCRSHGIAGVVSLAPDLDLEIRPKFAGPSDDWRGDLIFLALRSMSTNLDFGSTISAGRTSGLSLADLIGRTILTTIQRNHRQPLRMRRRTTFENFEFENEMEPEVFFNPGDEGWTRQSYVMTWDNEFWATIRHGSLALADHVKDVQILLRLREMVDRWGRTETPPSRFRRVLPPRLRHWQAAYDVCFEILQGNAFSPGRGPFSSFEFTLDMWRVWETLVGRSLVSVLGADKVGLQKEIKLGAVSRAGKSSPIIVRPDAIVGGEDRCIVDAKYKGRWDKDREPISAADRYEAMAFMSATGIDKAVLVYPDLAGRSVTDEPRLVQQEVLPTGTLNAVSIGLAGISKTGGRRDFAENLRIGLTANTPLISVGFAS